MHSAFHKAAGEKRKAKPGLRLMFLFELFHRQTSAWCAHRRIFKKRRDNRSAKKKPAQIIMTQRTAHSLYRAVAMVFLGLGLIGATALAGDNEWSIVPVPNNNYEAFILKRKRPVLNLSVMAWKPRWVWAGTPHAINVTSRNELKLRSSITLDKADKNRIRTDLAATKTDTRTVTYQYNLNADKNLDLTMIAVCFSMVGDHKGGAGITQADGIEKTFPLPPKRMAGADQATRIQFKIRDVGEITVSINPPCDIQFENGVLRVILAQKTFTEGKSAITLKIAFPSEVDFSASYEDQNKLVKTLSSEDWYEFSPSNDNGPSVISMNGWFEKPAGKHGRVKMVADHFEFEDGTPVKFWGTNLSYRDCAPNKENAEFTAARFAKYGINGVRLHKFCGPGWEGIGDSDDGTKLTSEGLDRLDYFCSKLTEDGIYYGFSHTFGYKIRPGNRNRITAYDEIEKGLKGSAYGLINFAEDIQDLMIEMVVNLLKHKNPYTGKTYAEDPALSYVELQNEDDIFFYTTERALKACPTYKKDLMKRFSDWLKGKYGSQEGLAEAWSFALKKGESIETGNIGIEGNPWFMSTEGLGKAWRKPGQKKRMLDNAAFLHETQNKFYEKFVKAIRSAGFQGPICGSPWQGPAMIPHYYNLRSDWLVGWIDRHNYFNEGIFGTMLSRPGSGYLGTGLQRVADRPFGISEWIHLYPDLYSAEGPAIMAAYGLGLQDWNASYEFNSDSEQKGFSKTVGHFPWNVYNVDVPTQIGQFPSLARMLFRGDVKKGEVVSSRKVSLKELQEGRFSFTDKIEQRGDIKVFGGTTPVEALAAGRCVVEFTDRPEKSPPPDMTRFAKGKVITSTTRQLVWDYEGKGHFTINTEGTKAVVGFADGKEFVLGNIKITMKSPYASVFITATDKGMTLANTRTAIVSAVARNCNSGFTYFTVDNRVLENGKNPIMLEPVKAGITIFGREIAQVVILDHDGRETDQKVAVTNGAFTIDGVKDKTFYYEVVFK